MTGHRHQRAAKGLLTILLASSFAWVPAAAGAQENPSQPQSQPSASRAVPEGDPGRISDWALAGVLWSDAHLVRRIAAASASEATNESQRQRMRRLQRECDSLIEALKRYGWQRVQAQATSTEATAASEQRETPARQRETAPTDAAQVPDPDRVGEALEQQVAGPSGTEGGANDEGDTETAPPGTLDRRVNTETPATEDDPGIDDEPQPDVEWFDLSQYRVDDFVDEASGEEANVADAVEDGAEGALAAGIDNSISEFDEGARRSERELMTRSQTLPVGEAESIYDTDDYDPNVDFEAENPAAVESGVDEDEDVLDDNFQDEPGLDARLDSEEVVNSEDELVRGLTGERGADESATAARRAAGQEAGEAPDGAAVEESLAPYTDEAEEHRADARWVQLHMATNQRRWDMITGEASPRERWNHLRAAIVQLKSDAQTVRTITDSSDLVRLLDMIAGT